MKYPSIGVNTLPLLNSLIQVYDIVRYRIHRAKKKVKDELEDRNTVQEYICPNGGCGRRFVLWHLFDGGMPRQTCLAELSTTYVREKNISDYVDFLLMSLSFNPPYL